MKGIKSEKKRRDRVQELARWTEGSRHLAVVEETR